jgi:hypothetical protein
MTERLGPKASGARYERFRDSLALVESSGNPSVEQRSTFAKGLYQFVPSQWGGWVEERLGRSLSSFMPKNDSPAEMARAAKEQREILFPAYYEDKMAPWIAKQRQNGLGKGKSDEALGAIFHQLGPGGGHDLLKSGVDSTVGTVDNASSAVYQRRVETAAAGNPGEVLAQAVSASKFRDNRIEGRANENDLRYSEELTKEERRARRVANEAKAKHQKAVHAASPQRGPPRPGEQRGPPRIATASSPQTSPVSFQPGEAMNENRRILGELLALGSSLSNDLASERALDRVRAEGRGE